MQHDSLFGHLATRFGAHPENLATEALGYVLNRSSVANRAFLRFLSQLRIELPDTLSFPDLVGSDAQGRRVLLVEAKFWAGLTDNQPLGYLRRLPLDTDSALIFIAPASRFSTLWPELVSRCKIAGVDLGEERTLGPEITARVVGQHAVLALVSWRSVLGFLLRALESEGQIEASADLVQLQGLCVRMDDNAFLPLTSEDLTANLGRRVSQYCQIVDEVTNLAVTEGMASITGLRAVGGFGWYGRYMRIHQCGCCLHFNAQNWARLRATPLWLSVKDHEWKLSTSIKEALSSFELEEPPRLLLGDQELLVPIQLLVGVEKDYVVQEVLVHLRNVAVLLRRYAVEMGLAADGA